MHARQGFTSPVGRSIQSLDAMRTLALCLTLLVTTESADACSFYFPVDKFTPTPTGHFDRQDAALPTLSADARILRRPAILGPGDVGGCDPFADFEVAVRSKDLKGAELGKYGYYFRVLTPNSPWTSIAPIPMKAKLDGDTALFKFSITDGTSSPTAPIDIDIEVFLVDNELKIGPTTRFHLHADPR
jgi:hypothetical protein